MDFEEMQVIWDSQGERQVYGLDREGLHRLVQRRRNRLACNTNVDEICLTLISLWVAGQMAYEPWAEGTDRHQYIGAALFLGVTLFMLVLRCASSMCFGEGSHPLPQTHLCTAAKHPYDKG